MYFILGNVSNHPFSNFKCTLFICQIYIDNRYYFAKALFNILKVKFRRNIVVSFHPAIRIIYYRLFIPLIWYFPILHYFQILTCCTISLCLCCYINVFFLHPTNSFQLSGFGLEAGLRKICGLLLRQVGELPDRQRPAAIHVRRVGQEQLEAELRNAGRRHES